MTSQSKRHDLPVPRSLETDLFDGRQDPRFPLIRSVRAYAQVDLVRVLVGDVTGGELEDAIVGRPSVVVVVNVDV